MFWRSFHWRSYFRWVYSRYYLKLDHYYRDDLQDTGTTYNNVKITAYGWNDNDDGAGTFGNAVIAYPQIRHGTFL